MTASPKPLDGKVGSLSTWIYFASVDRNLRMVSHINGLGPSNKTVSMDFAADPSFSFPINWCTPFWTKMEKFLIFSSHARNEIPVRPEFGIRGMASSSSSIDFIVTELQLLPHMPETASTADGVSYKCFMSSVDSRKIAGFMADTHHFPTLGMFSISCPHGPQVQ